VKKFPVVFDLKAENLYNIDYGYTMTLAGGEPEWIRNR
jgi:hypothetical protein